MKRGGFLKRYTPLRKVSAQRAKLGKVGLLASSLGLRRSKGQGGYTKRLTDVFNEYIRRRDADPITGLVKCISCPEVKHWREMDCGHFVPKSLGMSVRFEEKDCAAQCTYCNLNLQGNQHFFALALIEKHGAGIVAELFALAKTTRQIREPEYLSLIYLYKAKIKALEKLPEAA